MMRGTGNVIADIAEERCDCPLCDGLGEADEQRLRNTYGDLFFGWSVLLNSLREARHNGYSVCPRCEGKGYVVFRV